MPQTDRKAEHWVPWDPGIDIKGTAFDFSLNQDGPLLRVSVRTEGPDGHYELDFDLRKVVAYKVGFSDRINYVQVDGHADRGGVYLASNSHYPSEESEWEGAYSSADWHHLVIPSADATFEILTAVFPTARIVAMPQAGDGIAQDRPD